MGEKQKMERNTPGTAGGLGGRDRTLAVKSQESALFGIFFCISGSEAKDGERKKEERLNDGKNNGQAMHGARKPPGPNFPKYSKD